MPQPVAVLVGLNVIVPGRAGGACVVVWTGGAGGAGTGLGGAGTVIVSVLTDVITTGEGDGDGDGTTMIVVTAGGGGWVVVEGASDGGFGTETEVLVVVFDGVTVAEPVPMLMPGPGSYFVSHAVTSPQRASNSTVAASRYFTRTPKGCVLKNQ